MVKQPVDLAAKNKLKNLEMKLATKAGVEKALVDYQNACHKANNMLDAHNVGPFLINYCYVEFDRVLNQQKLRDELRVKYEILVSGNKDSSDV